MNAVLHENPISCYEVVYKDTKLLEVSGDTVVPDKMADIGILCDTKAEALLQSKNVQHGSVIVQGELRVSVNYIPDGKSGMCGLTLNIPWSAEFQGDAIPQNAFPVVDIQIDRVETRMLNPRKILFKGKLLVSLRVFDKHEHRLCDGIEGDGVIQGCVEEGEYSIISTVCERTFAATDEYPVPPAFVGGEIIGKSVRFRVDDIKTLTNKLIIKGTAESDVLLASENGEVEQVYFASGFSFISETECERVSDEVAVSIVPTAMYYELNGAGNMLSVEIHGVCQMLVYEKMTMRYISDVYSNFYPCDCTYAEMTALENRKITTRREKTSGAINCRSHVAKVCCASVNHHLEQRNDHSTARFTVSLCVKYEGGQYDWLTSTSEYELPCTADEVLNVCLWDVRTSVLGNEVEYQITFDCETLAETANKICTITEVHFDEQSPVAQDRPSLIAVHTGGRLWDLAKQYSSTVEQIKAYNQIESDAVSQGTFLLIPRQRLH